MLKRGSGIRRGTQNIFGVVKTLYFPESDTIEVFTEEVTKFKEIAGLVTPNSSESKEIELD